MNITKIKFIALSGLAVAFVFAGASIPNAQAQLIVTGSNTATTFGANGQAGISPQMSKIITDSDIAINARIQSLNNLNTRVQSLKNVGQTEKNNILTQVTANISGLASLKEKIDQDTDSAVAQTDQKSIFGSYRIYALVIPQGYIAASADRVQTIVDLMTPITVKFQTRIESDRLANKNVASVQAALADMTAKISAARAEAMTAQNSVALLAPDHGDKTQLAGNTATLKAARAHIKVATSDLALAREDARIIIKGLKVYGDVSATANGSAQ